MGRSIRVLHVDDDPEFAAISAEYLQSVSADIAVDSTHSMQAALEHLDDGVDCIVSDFEMPGGSGIMLLEQIRERYADLPFILFTGKGSEEIASRAISAGVTDYLQKRSGSEQFEILANRITNAVDRHRARLNYQEIFDKIPDGIILHKVPEGTILDANQQCCSLFGYSRDDMLECGFDELHAEVAPFTTERAQMLIRQAADDEPLTFEWLIKKSDGSFVPVEVHLTKTTIDGDERVMAAIRDITERKLNEHEHEQASKRMEMALDVTTAAIWEYDIEADTVTYHPEFHPVFQTRIEESSDYFERIHPEDRDRVARAFERAIDASEPFEVEFRTEVGGSTRWVEDYGEPLERSDGRQLMIGVARDITEQKARELVIEDERDRLSGLISTIPEPVAQLEMRDGEPIIQAVNHAYETTFGVDERDAIGHSNNEFVVPEGLLEEARLIDQRILEGESVVREVRRQTVDGIRDFLLRSVPVGTNNDGHLDCFVIYIDISEQKRREEDLTELKQRYQAYIEHASDVIAVIDENRTISYISPAVERMTGWDPDELTDRHLDSVVHPDDREVIHSLFKHGEVGHTRGEFRVSTADDDWLWIEASVSEQDDASYVINGRDISDRKRREEQRDQNEHYRQQLYQITSDPSIDPHETIGRLLELGCTSLDLSCGYVTRIDPSRSTYEVLRVAGHGVEEGLQNDLADTYCQYTLDDDTIVAIASAEEEGLEDHPAYTKHGFGCYIGGRLIVDDDQFGTVCFVDEAARPEGFSPEHKVFVELVCRWISHIYDRIHREQVITELHHVATELAHCETENDVFELTIEVASSLLDFDRSGIAIEEQGKLLVTAMSEQLDFDAPPTMEVDEGVAGLTYQHGESYLVSDITEFEMAVPQMEIGSAISIPIGDIGVFQVISEQPEAFDERDLALSELLIRHTENAISRLQRERELRRQNERLEQFSNVLSHDLRNPLNVAAGHLELLRGDHDDDAVEMIANALNRMDDIIDGTLSLARRGEMLTRMEPVSLSQVAHQSWATVSSGEATLEVIDDVTIEADPDPLRHILENLFHNAVDHGGRSVTVRVGQLDDGYFVEDDGVGLNGIDTERLFDLGYSTRPEGTGFGLSIVREIVNAHDWSIEVSEAEGGGTRFAITGVRILD